MANYMLSHFMYYVPTPHYQILFVNYFLEYATSRLQMVIDPSKPGIVEHNVLLGVFIVFFLISSFIPSSLRACHCHKLTTAIMLRQMCVIAKLYRSNGLKLKSGCLLQPRHALIFLLLLFLCTYSYI